ncbi:MAG TPA: ATP-binding cassette domain-containing protein [Candidatus Eisenbacteria bacterium]|jgi:ATP-binding cassette subfamily B protein
MKAAAHSRRRWLVPEVVQTSAMDCGPASLKCLLEGFGIRASYGRLREACQTDVDGTSIDTLEEVANQLGLVAQQVMVPVDHVLIPEARLLPALAVVELSNHVTHFLVLWRRHGRFVQVMDPATGRRWPTCRGLLDELYPHRMPVPAGGWRAWAGSEESLGALENRLADLGVDRASRQRVLGRALADPGWRSLAAVDAATRLVDSIVRARGIARGHESRRVLERFLSRAEAGGAEDASIPSSYWSVRPGPPGFDGTPQLVFRGAVLVHVEAEAHAVHARATGDGTNGSRAAPEAPAAADAPDRSTGGESSRSAAGPTDGSGQRQPLSPELVAALSEPPSQPGRRLLELMRRDGWLAPGILVAALLLAASAVVIEALLFRALFDLGRELGLSGQRLGAIGALLAFALGLLVLELPLMAGLFRIGRQLEARLRIAFLEKIPRLADRYFHSRLTSDMAERSHVAHTLRSIPELGGEFLRRCFELVLTTAGIIWLDPGAAPAALAAALVAVGLPLAMQSPLIERDLRMRNHAGALSRFYLDALLGLVPVRAHGAERAVRREHESLLVEWSRAGLGLQRAVVATEGVQQFAGFALAAWLLLGYLARGSESGSVLLLVYWALNLPFLGTEIGLIARQYPSERNLTLRLLEPLGAPEEIPGRTDEPDAPSKRAQAADESERATGHRQGRTRGVAIALQGVSVRAAGRTILEGLDLEIPAGSHVAIVGPSGAGKSSLVGLLLGWHRPAAGQVLIDGACLDGERLEELRRETAWVDPAVQLWNRSLLDNLQYGAGDDSAAPAIGAVIQEANLVRMLETLPEGLQTPLGEGGSLVSGGEGQRVRLGRAMLKSGVRLGILDEPFRGLDRPQRRVLLERARRRWRDATLLCITHDVAETLGFERVLVVDQGRIAEDGAPRVLAGLEGSRYRGLLEAERATQEGLWSLGAWRRLALESGRLQDGTRNGGSA